MGKNVKLFAFLALNRCFRRLSVDLKNFLNRKDQIRFSMMSCIAF